MNLDTLQEWLSQLSPRDFPWLWEVFLVVVIMLVANFILRLLLSRLQKRFKETVNLWDDALLEAAQRPARLLIWVVGFCWVLDILRAAADAEIFEMLGPARQVIIIALITWFVIRLVTQVEVRLRSADYVAEPVDETTVLALGKLIRTAVIITASLVVLQTLGYSISGVLAFGGIGGIAVGFAAKDLLSNFFGGLMIYLDRPFAVGDWIRSPDKNIEGVVEDIGWRLCRIRTFDKRPLYIPNGTFAQISVENPSRMLNRRIFETIGLRYDDAALVEKVVTDVYVLFSNDEDIDTDQTLMVNFTSFGPSSLDFFIYTFTKTTNWVEYHKVKQRLMLETLNIIHRHGADVAYPTQTLKVEEVERLATEEASK